MSANVETMFYVKQTPWHGLGTRVEEAKTSQDALKLAGLDWKVYPQPIYLADGTEIPNQKANVRDKDNTVLGIVKDRYQIVQNDEAFSFTDLLLGEGVTYETAGSLSDGKRVWMLAKMPERKVLGDKVEPYLVFSNSHDGLGAVKVALTPIRVVCQNTLTLALSSANRVWSTKHTGNIANKLEDARLTLELASMYLDNMDEEADRLSQITVFEPEFANFVTTMFPTNKNMSDRQISNIEKQRNGLKNIYNNVDNLQKFYNTAWGVVNAVADFAPHFLPTRMTTSYKENNFFSIVDGGKQTLMERACAYFK